MYCCRQVLRESEKDTCDDKSTALLIDNVRNLKAYFILLAIITKANYKDATFKCIQDRSTEDLPLGNIRREWTTCLKNLYDDCIRPGKSHILPDMETNRLNKSDKRKLEHKCYDILAESILKHFFCNVKQLVYKGNILIVPTRQGKEERKIF